MVCVVSSNLSAQVMGGGRTNERLRAVMRVDPMRRIGDYCVYVYAHPLVCVHASFFVSKEDIFHGEIICMVLFDWLNVLYGRHVEKIVVGGLDGFLRLYIPVLHADDPTGAGGLFLEHDCGAPILQVEHGLFARYVGEMGGMEGERSLVCIVHPV